MRPGQYDVGGAQILGKGNFTLVGQHIRSEHVPRTLLLALGPGHLGMDMDIALDSRWEASSMDRSILGTLNTDIAGIEATHSMLEGCRWPMGSPVKVYDIPTRGSCQCALSIIDLSEAVK